MTKVKLELIKGDITERGTDAIINTANNMLILGSGLGGAIKAKGGESIAKACSKYGTIEVGDAVITTAGKLKTKYIIHAAITEFDGLIEEDMLSKALLSSLRLANERKLKSIAIPDMSMRIIRFPPEKCGQTIFTVLKKFILKENQTIELIEIVVWDIDTLRTYKELYTHIFKQETI